MKPFLDKYFEFTKRELNGLLGLLFLIVMVTLIPSVYTMYYDGDLVQKFDKQALNYIDVHSKAALKTEWKNSRSADKVIHRSKLFQFDPNTIDAGGWMKLGLSAKQAGSIVNYRNKGGKFFKPEDLQKMYTIRPELYKQLLPFVAIKSSGIRMDINYSKQENRYKKPPVNVVDINTADTIDLDGLKGIGAAFARRIIAYRDRLGGFYEIAQLKEVYGLDSARFATLAEQIKINSGIKKININSATFEELKNHPYLRYKEINAIIQYRKQHGSFSEINDLKKIIALSEKTLQKIAPYLTF